MGDGLFLVLPFLHAILGIAFLLVARLDSRPARYWGAGFLAAAGAHAVPLALGFAAETLQAVVSCTLFVLGFTLFGMALRARFGLPLHPAAHAAFVVLAAAAAAVAMVGFGSLRYEVLINDITCALPILLVLLTPAPRRRAPLDRTLVWMSAAIITDTVGRSLWFFANTASEAGAADFLASPYLATMQVVATMAGLLYALTALFAEGLDIIARYRDGAERDPLTGLFNRRGFEKALRGLSGARLGGAVLTCDIDHFKRVNDRHGHDAGDRVIKALADTLRLHMPPGAVAARFGGEEFVAFVPAIDLKAGEATAEAIRGDFAHRTGSLDGLGEIVTASFGVVTADDGTLPCIQAAIEIADAGLLKAKAEGRDRVIAVRAARTGTRPAPSLVFAA